MKTDTDPPAACRAVAESEGGPGQSIDLLTPRAQASHIVNHVTQYITKNNITAADVAEILDTAKLMDGDGESVLFYQSQLLDSLFHRLGYEACTEKRTLDAEKLHLALRMQKQCRATLESMAFLKHMKNMRK